jgi:hypothetical protein
MKPEIRIEMQPELRIESGIPLPRKGGKSASFLAQMQLGDSVCCDRKTKARLMNAARKMEGRKYIARQVIEDNRPMFRIWRMK